MWEIIPSLYTGKIYLRGTTSLPSMPYEFLLRRNVAQDVEMCQKRQDARQCGYIQCYFYRSLLYGIIDQTGFDTGIKSVSLPVQAGNYGRTIQINRLLSRFMKARRVPVLLQFCFICQVHFQKRWFGKTTFVS